MKPARLVTALTLVATAAWGAEPRPFARADKKRPEHSLQKQLELELDAFLKSCGVTPPADESPLPDFLWNLWRDPSKADPRARRGALAEAVVINAGNGLSVEGVFSRLVQTKDAAQVMDALKKSDQGWLPAADAQVPQVRTSRTFSFYGNCSEYADLFTKGDVVSPWFSAAGKAKLSSSKKAGLALSVARFVSPLVVLADDGRNDSQQTALQFLLWDYLGRRRAEGATPELANDRPLYAIKSFAGIPVAFEADERNVQDFTSEAKTSISYLVASLEGRAEYASRGLSILQGNVRRILILGAVEGKRAVPTVEWLSLGSPKKLHATLQARILLKDQRRLVVELRAGQGSDLVEVKGLPHTVCGRRWNVEAVPDGAQTPTFQRPVGGLSSADGSCVFTWDYGGAELSGNADLRLVYGVNLGDLIISIPFQRDFHDDLSVTPKVNCEAGNCSVTASITPPSGQTLVGSTFIDKAKFSCELAMVHDKDRKTIIVKQSAAEVECRSVGNALTVKLKEGTVEFTRPIAFRFDVPALPPTHPVVPSPTLTPGPGSG